jgi:hypothetical protein
MINFKQLSTKENIVEETIKLGDSVVMYRNGKLQGILDMKYDVGLNNLISIKEDDILYGTRSESIINIILKDGDIIELSFGNAANGKNNIDTVKDTKIITSKKFKKHMLVHQNDFNIPYNKLIKYMENKGYFENLQDGFVEMVVELPFNIGYNSMVETDDTHKIVYAKRKGRNIYSRLTLSGEKTLTNKCVVILKQNYTNSSGYYVITMFPGEYLVREVQDRNIKSKEERKRVLDFWNKHALAIDFTEIDCETITSKCPYI